LREIADIKVQHSRSQAKRYHKESLSDKQRDRLLRLCATQRERAVISLIAWNGLRTIEVLRLTAPDVRFRERKLAVWGKGKSSRSKDVIWLIDVPGAEVKKYLKQDSVTHGKAFPGLSKTDVAKMIS
jgi:integrase